jgi:peptide/nickel transport system substrate-binding protein
LRFSDWSAISGGPDAAAPDRHRPVQIHRIQAERTHQNGEKPGLLEEGLPYFDGIEYTIVKSRSTAILAFVAGNYELTFAGTLTIPLTRDLRKQRPDAICDLPPGSVSTNLIVNRDKPPFDKPELRRAMSLAIDRPAFIDILTEDQGFRAAAMQPPPGGLWGMPRDRLDKLPGYGPDVAANREAAREIMKKLGYGPEKPMRIKIPTRDVPSYRDPAVILIDQLKGIYIAAELEMVDRVQWYPKVQRAD